jgi:hypothetical protein
MASSLSWELPLPAHFEAVAESVIYGPDPARYLAAISEYAEAGYDHVCRYQVGPDQAGIMRFHQRELLPRVRSVLTG